MLPRFRLVCVCLKYIYKVKSLYFRICSLAQAEKWKEIKKRQNEALRSANVNQYSMAPRVTTSQPHFNNKPTLFFFFLFCFFIIIPSLVSLRTTRPCCFNLGIRHTPTMIENNAIRACTLCYLHYTLHSQSNDCIE